MPAEKSVSFRTHLLSNATDLIEEIQLHCARTAKLIVGLVSQLAAYTEEGVPLTPTVFICNSIVELLRRAGSGEHIPLSGTIATESAAGQILKAAAPLCSENWRIYIERSDNAETCKFGVFCGSSDPSSLTLDEIVLDGFEPGFPIVRIAQSAVNRVEVRTNSGSGIEFRFNDDIDVAHIDSRHQISCLAQIASRNIDSPPFPNFMERLLNAAIRECHGTLIAVTSLGDDNLPDALKDAVPICPPLDLYERFSLHQEEGKTAASVSRLQSAVELVSGFIRSDGITVLSSTGKIIAYRAFVHNDAASPPSSGGARSRAFAALSDLIGSSLSCAFFRSQDGRTAIKTDTQEH